MIRLTPQAAAAVRRTASQCDADGMYLRISAQRAEGGALVHCLGFDERRLGDCLDQSEGIVIVANRRHRPLLNGTVVDFVELNSGDARFVCVSAHDTGCASFLGACGGCAKTCREIVD